MRPPPPGWRPSRGRPPPADRSELPDELDASKLRFGMVSESAQDYLKAIWKLERAGEMSTSALAESLGVAPASATAMLKKLATLGLVVHERYHGATLTPAGERMALEVVRHHRLLELYLMEALGLTWDQVHQEAERLEHQPAPRHGGARHPPACHPRPAP